MIIFRHKTLWLAILAIIIASTGIIKLQKNSLIAESEKQKKTSYLKQEKSLQATVEIQKGLPSFSLDNLIADWNYLQFIQYFGDTKAREATGYSLVTDYFEVIADKDPHFTQAFLSLSAANSLFAGRPEKTVDFINEVLESASPNLPGYPFLLWTYKATDEILFLGDLEAAKNSYKMAAKWASQRDDEIGDEMASRYLTTAKYLAGNPDSRNARIVAWTNVLNQAPDSKTQQRAIDELKKLGVDVLIDQEGKFTINRTT